MSNQKTKRMCVNQFRTLDKKAGEYKYFSCGYCPECVRKSKMEQVALIKQEHKESVISKFVTLTYAEHNLPVIFIRQVLNVETGEYFKIGDIKKLYEVPYELELGKDYVQTIYPKDISNYIRNLKQNTKRKVRYHCAPEYGDNTSRPHYHLALFNVEPEEIEKRWSHGIADIKPLKNGGAEYIAKYVSKFTSNTPKGAIHPRRQRSEKWGYGLLTPEVVKQQIEQETLRIPTENGKFIHMPKRWKKALWNEEEYIEVMERYKAKMDKENSDVIYGMTNDEIKIEYKERRKDQLERAEATWRKMVDKSKSKRL